IGLLAGLLGLLLGVLVAAVLGEYDVRGAGGSGGEDGGAGGAGEGGLARRGGAVVRDAAARCGDGAAAPPRLLLGFRGRVVGLLRGLLRARRITGLRRLLGVLRRLARLLRELAELSEAAQFAEVADLLA